MERSIICLAVSTMIFGFSPAHAFTMVLDEADRPGCDYKNFVAAGANPDANATSQYYACRDACGLDTTCQAWNFDRGTCFLKNCTPGTKVNHGTAGGFKL